MNNRILNVVTGWVDYNSCIIQTQVRQIDYITVVIVITISVVLYLISFISCNADQSHGLVSKFHQTIERLILFNVCSIMIKKVSTQQG